MAEQADVVSVVDVFEVRSHGRLNPVKSSKKDNMENVTDYEKKLWFSNSSDVSTQFNSWESTSDTFSVNIVRSKIDWVESSYGTT